MTTTAAKASLWDTFEHTPSFKQRVFMRYFTAILVDLVVLLLFAEYWEHVHVSGFTVALLASVLLQILLKAAILAEHKVAAFFNARRGGFNKCMRYVGAWAVLFASKFAILEALVLAFGDRIRFGGWFHGIVALIVVVVVMLVAEAFIVWIYRRMGNA